MDMVLVGEISESGATSMRSTAAASASGDRKSGPGNSSTSSKDDDVDKLKYAKTHHLLKRLPKGQPAPSSPPRQRIQWARGGDRRLRTGPRAR